MSTRPHPATLYGPWHASAADFEANPGEKYVLVERYKHRHETDSWQARSLKKYITAKIGVSLPAAVRPIADLVVNVDPLLVAAANGASSDDAHEVLGWSKLSTKPLACAVAAWRDRGRAMLAAYPDLYLDQPEAGPPRGLRLPDDAPPPPIDEMERAATGTAAGTPARLRALVIAALNGDLNWSRLPHHIVCELLASIEALEKRRIEWLAAPPSAPLDPAEDIEAIEAAFGGIGSGVYFAALAAALGSARAALAALAEPPVPPPTGYSDG